MVHVEGNWVRFEFYRPGADRVSVAGDFNGWRAGQIELQCGGNGLWIGHLRLPPGKYRFRYCADGEWYADYAANGLEPGRFGLDSILLVSDKVVPSREAPPEGEAAYYRNESGSVFTN